MQETLYTNGATRNGLHQTVNGWRSTLEGQQGNPPLMALRDPSHRPLQIIKKLQRWVACGALTFGVSVFYAFFPAAAARHFFGLSEVHSLLFVGLPVAVLVGAFFWPRIPKLVGLQDEP